MVSVFGWIMISVSVIITMFEVYWDTSRRVYQQIEQNKKNRNALPYFPSGAWMRMNTQYILCFVNVVVSIVLYHLDIFWIFLSVFLILLLLDIQFMAVKTNASYLRMKYNSMVRRNPKGNVVLCISATLMLIVAFHIFWSLIWIIHCICHTFHFIVYYKWSRRYTFSDSNMNSSLGTCVECHAHMFSGCIDAMIIYLILVVVLVFGNVFGDTYMFYLYIYPLCIMILQISNFQTDYRNRISYPRCCVDYYRNRIVLPQFNEARRIYFRRHPSQGKYIEQQPT
eukprot:790553_1